MKADTMDFSVDNGSYVTELFLSKGLFAQTK